MRIKTFAMLLASCACGFLIAAAIFTSRPQGIPLTAPIAAEEEFVDFTLPGTNVWQVELEDWKPEIIRVSSPDTGARPPLPYSTKQLHLIDTAAPAVQVTVN